MTVLTELYDLDQLVGIVDVFCLLFFVQAICQSQNKRSEI